jgi:hypothetical protein
VREPVVRRLQLMRQTYVLSDIAYLTADAIRILEDGELETAARLDYDNKLDHAFTAHPKLDPDTGLFGQFQS